MPTRNIVLTRHQENFLGELVATGVYQNASEVLRDGLRLLESQLTRRKAELVNIQAGVLTGLEQIEHGRLASGSGEEAIERALNRAVKKRNM